MLATIEWLVNDFAARSGIAVDLALPEEEFEFDPELSTALFRVLQESLTNVARHAGADRVRVVLSGTDSDVRLSVEDNGKGIEISLEDAPKTFGLLGMRERASMLGGELSVHGKPGAGTSIVMIVPRRPRPEAAP